MRHAIAALTVVGLIALSWGIVIYLVGHFIVRGW
jgi:uncharacterized membrane protein YiaA